MSVASSAGAQVKSSDGITTGIMFATRSRINTLIKRTKSAPVSTSTSSGTAAVYLPPTVQAPPSATAAVAQQLETSKQLAENSKTGIVYQTNGDGTVTPIGKRKKVSVRNTYAYALLALLGGGLLIAYAHDRGKL
jgi:hypothetical protein